MAANLSSVVARSRASSSPCDLPPSAYLQTAEALLLANILSISSPWAAKNTIFFRKNAKKQKMTKFQNSSKTMFSTSGNVTTSFLSKNWIICASLCGFSSHGDPFRDNFYVFYMKSTKVYQNRQGINRKSTRNQLEIDRKSTRNQPEIDQTSTRNRPETNVGDHFWCPQGARWNDPQVPHPRIKKSGNMWRWIQLQRHFPSKMWFKDKNSASKIPSS